MKSHGYMVCFLDVLGFKTKVDTLGIDELYKRYDELTGSCREINDRYKHLFQSPFQETPIGTADKNLAFLYRVYVHYASDSIILWAERTWEMYKNIKSDKDIHFATPWIKYPKPYDPFLFICNEIICKGIEMGLPLRGAISVGEGRFDFEKNHYIGSVVNECVGIEKLHNIVGISVGKELFKQPVPHRFYLDFDKHLKTELTKDQLNSVSNKVLDWPRHWRRTRLRENIFDYLKVEEFENNELKFNITKALIIESEIKDELFETHDEINAFVFYKDWFKIIDGFPIRFIEE